MFQLLDEKINALLPAELAAEIAALLPESAAEDEKLLLSARVENILSQKIWELRMAQEETKDAVEDSMEKLAETTSDLKQMPRLGQVGLFLRGMQRPIWGFALLWMDLKVFSGSWQLAGGDANDVAAAFWLTNLLVLGFLFGERAVKNVMPMVGRRLGGGTVQ